MIYLGGAISCVYTYTPNLPFSHGSLPRAQLPTRSCTNDT